MAKYTVQLSCLVHQTVEVEVEADSEDEAAKKADVPEGPEYEGWHHEDVNVEEVYLKIDNEQEQNSE